MQAQYPLDPADQVRRTLEIADRIYGETTLTRRERYNPEGIREKFIRYHLDNPHVYNALVEQALVLRRQTSLPKTGIDFIHSRVRWLAYLRVNTDDDYKMSNGYRPEYARLIMVQVHELAGFFDTKGHA